MAARRLLARLLDLAPPLVLTAVLFALGVLVEERALVRASAVALAAGSAGWTLVLATMLHLRGDTPGKRALGLAVETEAGRAPPLLRALGRETLLCLALVPLLGPILCAADLGGLFVRDGRALHDHVCGTRVIDRRPRSTSGRSSSTPPP